MVFRKDSKVDAFQRQISALRHQLGGEHDPFPLPESDRFSEPRSESSYRSTIPELESIGRELPLPAREMSHQSPARDERVQSSTLPAVPAVDTQTSIIAHSTVWTGNLESTGSLHIHGQVDGSLSARDDIFIAEEAVVDATINATSVTIAGIVRGTVNCLERFEVLPQGRVAGDIRAPMMVIHEGALVTGEIVMTASLDARSPAPLPAPAMRAVRGGD